MNILFVCTGNTCRSPMAEYIARDILKNYNIDSFVFSRGINVIYPERASKNALLALKKHNIDAINHMSKQISKEDVQKADIILTMTNEHKQFLNSIFPESNNKTWTLKEYVNKQIEQYNIIDPFGCVLDVYESCLMEIKENVEKAIEKLVLELEN